MAAAAIPVGASLLAPEIAGAAAPLLAGTLFEGAAPWLTGAALGGIGGLLTGQNPLQGALLGGIGGGIANKFMPNGLGGLFDGGGADVAANGDIVGKLYDGASSAIPESGSLMSDIPMGSLNGIYNPADVAAQASTGISWTPDVASAATSGGLGGISKFLPYAAVAGGASVLDSMNRPKNAGTAMKGYNPNSPKSMPLDRAQQTVDPNSYFTSGGNRSYFDNINPLPTYANGGSSSASSSNIPQNSRRINGPGDGRSDSIPARLSDGEFVVSAPVVSALGKGSNAAGARKLDKLQKTVMHKNYKGGKPPKTFGLGGYVH